MCPLARRLCELPQWCVSPLRAGDAHSRWRCPTHVKLLRIGAEGIPKDRGEPRARSEQPGEAEGQEGWQRGEQEGLGGGEEEERER